MELVLQSQVQRPEHLFVMLFPFLLNTESQTISLSFVVCQSQIFQDRHAGTGSHRRILKNTADLAHSPVLFLSGDIFPVDGNTSGIHRDTSADQI